MTPGIVVRQAEPHEAPLVFALMRAAFAETAIYPNPSSALSETLSLARERAADGAAIIGLEGGRPAGSGRFRVDVDGRYLAYERLAVHPALRDRGVASAMVRFLEDHARDLGLLEVRADARSQQPDNRRFYLDRGYAIIGYTDRYGIANMRTHMAKSL